MSPSLVGLSTESGSPSTGQGRQGGHSLHLPPSPQKPLAKAEDPTRSWAGGLVSG